MTTNEELLRHLTQMADFFKEPMCPLERFILKHGQDFPGRKRPKGVHKREDKQCFKNSTQLALNSRGNYRYVEGFAVHNDLIPMFHAWCINILGEVVDVTWRYPERSVYRGVVIPHSTLRKHILRNRVYGVLDYGMIDVVLINQLSQELDNEQVRPGLSPDGETSRRQEA